MRRGAALRLAALATWAGLAALACGRGGSVSGVDATDLLRRAADRTEQAQRFHFLIEHENGATVIVNNVQMERAEGDIDGAARMRADIKGKAGPINVQIGIVIIDGDGWLTNPLTGRWEHQPLSIEAFFDPQRGVPALLRQVTAAQSPRREQLNGAAVYRVAAHVDSGALTLLSPGATPGRSLPAVAWIGIDDPRVYRLEVTGAVASGERSDLLRRITLSRFDEPVAIQPPR